MKKIWIGVAGLAAVLAVVLVIVSLMSPKGSVKGERVESSDEESLYPYAYTKTAEGMEIQISGPFAEGFTWTAVADTSAVKVEEKKQSDQEAVFAVKAVQTGRGTLQLFLQRGSGAMAEHSYEITIELLAASQGDVTVLSNTHREISSMAEGSGNGFAYQAADQADGTVKVLLTSEEAMSWVPASEGTSVQVEFAEVQDNQQTVVLRYAELGQTWVRLCAGETGQAVELYVTTDALAHVSLVKHGIVNFSAPDENAVVLEDPQFEALYGVVTLPQDAVGVERSVVDWDNSGREAGYVGFACNGFRWELYLFHDDAPENWSTGSIKAGTPVESVGIQIGKWNSGRAALWTMNDSTWLLRCDEAAKTDIQATAESVIMAVLHG